MKMKLQVACLLMLVMTVTQVQDASAAAIVTGTQVGNDVVFEATGTVDLDGLTLLDGGGSASPNVNSNSLHMGVDAYLRFNGIMGPDPVPAATPLVFASSTTGAHFGILWVSGPPALALSVGYTSGDAIQSSATFENTTLAALGFTPGTYVWTWGLTHPVDNVTLQIAGASSNAVPEPTSLAIFGLLGLVAGGRRRRKQKQAA